MTEAEDARHDVPPRVKMAVEKASAAKPDEPTPRDPLGPDWEGRAQEQQARADAEIRAKALELALAAATVGDVVQSDQVFPFAERFAHYIKTGERPA
jgi:hypothetical protein